MTVSKDFVAAATTLVERRASGIQGGILPVEQQARDVNDAVAIQAEVEKQWCEKFNDTVGGWKCLVPPAEDKIVIGRIFKSTVTDSADISLFPKGDLARIEPELAFTFEKSLPSKDTPYTEAEVDAAIGSAHMALELIHSAYLPDNKPEFFDALAAGLVNQGLYLGPEVDLTNVHEISEIDLSFTYNDETREIEGKHPTVNPKAPLYWLVEFLRSNGLGIEAGQSVITGSYAGIVEVPMNTSVEIGYAGIGKMTVKFSAK